MKISRFRELTGFDKLDGKEINIAIFDSGCSADIPNIVETINLVNKDSKETVDARGHGTMVASIISELAPESNIIIYKTVDDNGRASMKSLYDSLKEILIRGDIDIVNMSISSIQDLSITTKRMLKRCIDSGIIFVAPIGNNGRNERLYPSICDGVFSVGGLKDNLVHIADTSNFNIETHFVAPSENISSKYVDYERTGTSFASAIITGQIACLMSKYGFMEYRDFIPHFISESKKLQTSYGVLTEKGEN